MTSLADKASAASAPHLTHPNYRPGVDCLRTTVTTSPQAWDIDWRSYGDMAISAEMNGQLK